MEGISMLPTIPKKTRSRTYRVMVQYKETKDAASHSVMIEGNISYRAALLHVNNFQKLWEALNVHIIRSRAMCSVTLEDKFLGIWFEQER